MSSGLGPYELLASLMLRAHGSLKEIQFLAKPKDFVLVFSDGMRLQPQSEGERKQWYLSHRELLSEFLSAGYRGDPLHVLGFGYSGTGSSNLAVLLRSCGFVDTTIVTSETSMASLPIVLTPDGKLADLS